MAEKKLKRDIDMTVQELQEVRDALLQKLFPAYTLSSRKLVTMKRV